MLEACPPWLIGLAGYGLGAMSRESLGRLRSLAAQQRAREARSAETDQQSR